MWFIVFIKRYIRELCDLMVCYDFNLRLLIKVIYFGIYLKEVKRGVKVFYWYFCL